MAFTDWIADEQEEQDIEVTDDVTIEDETSVEESVETTEAHSEEEQDVTPAIPSTYNINGQEVTLEELQQGYIRQQDYISKNDEINRLREENKQALELVEYLRKNPNLANRLMNEENVDSNVTNVINPAMDRVERLERELYKQNINATINGLKAKYSDFNEVDVMNRALSLGTNDLEFVYHGMRGASLDSIVAQRVKEQLAQAQAEMQKNTQATRTIVGNAKHTEVSKTSNLTQQQMRVADAMGISYEDYEKYI